MILVEKRVISKYVDLYKRTIMGRGGEGECVLYHIIPITRYRTTQKKTYIGPLSRYSYVIVEGKGKQNVNVTQGFTLGQGITTIYWTRDNYHTFDKG